MKWWTNWRLRHQHPANLALHVIGIPMTLVAVGLAVVQLIDWRWDLWWRPAILLVAGYVLQGLGHAIEGNTMGEMILIRKWRGRPYVGIAARYCPADPEAGPPRRSAVPPAEAGEAATK